MGVLHRGESSEAMNAVRCDGCGKAIEARDAAYHVWLWVVARVNDGLDPSRLSNWDAVVAHVSEQLAGAPEEQIASEVYARRSYLVCLKCKEHMVSDPLHGTGVNDGRGR